ncbi:MAG: type II secretion system protein [bacterium]|nr:type II secretion system protein [bacterium]
MTPTIHNQNIPDSKKHCPARSAFTLVEAMLSLSIMAILMLAAATAMKVSVQGHEENDKVTRAMQGARSTLERLSRQIRTAESASFTRTTASGTYEGQSVTMNVTTLVITGPQDGSDLEQVQYVHMIPMGSTVGGKLYYNYQPQGQSLTSPTLAMLGEEDDIEVESFDITTLSEGLVTANTKVQFTLNVGGRQFDFSTAVALRGNEY